MLAEERRKQRVQGHTDRPNLTGGMVKSGASRLVFYVPAG